MNTTSLPSTPASTAARVPLTRRSCDVTKVWLWYGCCCGSVLLLVCLIVFVCSQLLNGQVRVLSASTAGIADDKRAHAVHDIPSDGKHTVSAAGGVQKPDTQGDSKHSTSVTVGVANPSASPAPCPASSCVEPADDECSWVGAVTRAQHNNNQGRNKPHRRQLDWLDPRALHRAC